MGYKKRKQKEEESEEFLFNWYYTLGVIFYQPGSEKIDKGEEMLQRVFLGYWISYFYFHF